MTKSHSWERRGSAAALELELRRRAKRRRQLAAAAAAGGLAAAVALGCGIMGAGRGSASAARVPAARSPAVLAAKGHVEARQAADLGPRAPGRVRELRVREGERVERGGVLAVLENDDAAAAVERARAALTAAEARLAEVEAGPRAADIAIAREELRRAKADLALRETELAREIGLAASLSSSPERTDLARTRREAADAAARIAESRLAMLLEGARSEHRRQALAEVEGRRAELRLAEALLEATIVRAPFAGVVVCRYLDAGEPVVPELGTPILRIADLGRTRIRCEIDEDDAARLATGLAARVRARGFGDRAFEGTVVEVALEMGKKRIVARTPGEMVDTTVIEAVIELAPEAAPRLPLGLTVDVEIALGSGAKEGAQARASGPAEPVEVSCATR